MASPVTIPAPRYPAKMATAADALERIRRLPKPLVFTNGVFDVLHRGHVTCLEQARALGASLVVAVNTDASVRRLRKAATVRSTRSPIGWRFSRRSRPSISWFPSTTTRRAT
jgi:cytidyltransferase-like protein